MPSRMARAEPCTRTPTGFQLIELNMGSNLGGLDKAVLNEAMQKTPFRRLRGRHELTYVDTMVELATASASSAPVPPGTRTVHAAVDYPPRYPTLAALLDRSAAAFARLGIDCGLHRSTDSPTTTMRSGWTAGGRGHRVPAFHLGDCCTRDARAARASVAGDPSAPGASCSRPWTSDMYGSKATWPCCPTRTIATASGRRAGQPGSDRALDPDRTPRYGHRDAYAAGTHRYGRANRPNSCSNDREHGGQGVVLGWMSNLRRGAIRPARRDRPTVRRAGRIHPTLESSRPTTGRAVVDDLGCVTLARGFAGSGCAARAISKAG